MITTMHSDQNASPPRVEVITSVQRRRRWPTAEKIRLVEETMQPGMSVSYVARRAGVAPSLLFNWRRRMLEGGLRAVQADEDVVGTSRVRELERRVRELERLLGRKTMEVEILKEALDVARVKKPSLQLSSWNDRKDGSERAAEMRASSKDLKDNNTAAVILRLAELYDRLADRAGVRSIAKLETALAELSSDEGVGAIDGPNHVNSCE